MTRQLLRDIKELCDLYPGIYTLLMRIVKLAAEEEADRIRYYKVDAATVKLDERYIAVPLKAFENPEGKAKP
jgi:hypothetical protein